MIPKFSVRKPYTVLVAVLLIIILGIISYVNLTTDLLPEMELPYVVVITPYPGASPEKVESTVTVPLESVLGTSSGLKNINSISGENSSMVILEYVQDTNMDSAMIELSGNIDIASAQFDDQVGTPILMKISPEMIPVVVASVDRSDMDTDQLTAFSKQSVIPYFERLDGVAAVNAVGLSEKQFEIRLNEEKLTELSDKVRKHIEDSLEKTKNTLEESEKELAKGRAALEKEAPDQKANLSKASAELDATIANLTALLAQETLLSTEKTALEQEKAGLMQLSDINSMFEQFFPLGIENLSAEMYQGIIEQAGDNLPQEIAGLSHAEMIEMSEKAADSPARIAQIDAQLQNINIRQMTFEAMKSGLENGLAEAKAGYEKLQEGIITAAVELAKASINLENGEAEIKKGIAEFDKAKKEALSGADLNSIITDELVKQIVSAQNFNMPAGYIINGSNQHLVKVGDSFNSSRQIEDMVIFSMEPVGDIMISDIADTKLTDNSDDTYAKVNGNDAIVLIFQKQSTASTSEVANSINDEIINLQEQYEGLSIKQLMDQGDYIHMITGSVIQNLLIGGALAILILLLFLRDIKPTFIIALSIPISLTFAVTLMYFSKVTLNVMSLAGLALGVGMLVDNSIVVIENIYRLRNQGMSAVKAAVMGARQVSGAILASTLTTVCVFLPIVFTQGISRQLFTDMGLTIAYSLFASLLISLSLVPAMSSVVFEKANKKKHNLFDALVRIYGRVLKGALKKRWIPLVLAVILLGVSIYGVTIMGTEFMPEIDSPQLSAEFEVNNETSSREEIFAINDKVIDRILEIEAVETVGAINGEQSGISFMGGGSDTGSSLYILLKEERSLTNRDVERLIYEKTEDLDIEISVTASNMDMSMLGGSGIQAIIKGRDLDKLTEIANDIADIMRNTPGTVNVTTGLEDADKETRIQVDKAKAMREGLTVAQIYAEISSALNTKSQATVITEGDEDLPVIIVKGSQRITLDNIYDFMFTVEQRDGTKKDILLSDIASISQADSLLSISRENQSRYMTVSADIADGYNVGLVGRDFEGRLEEYDVPTGYEISMAGENELIREALYDLVLMIALAVAFIYLIMVAQFQSLLSPFIIMFTLPLAFTGGLLLLWICNMEVSVISMVGFLMLSGVVVNNGIVYVSYVNQLREEGMEKRQALITAGVTRIRPILMTSLTTILAMSTMALGFGSGAEMIQPMAVVTIGGLMYATVLTLFIVPVLYDLLHRKQIKKAETE